MKNTTEHYAFLRMALGVSIYKRDYLKVLARKPGFIEPNVDYYKRGNKRLTLDVDGVAVDTTMKGTIKNRRLQDDWVTVGDDDDLVELDNNDMAI
jgi:hypothetical protein